MLSWLWVFRSFHITTPLPPTGLLAAGGIYGFVKSKSVPSLVAGLGFAALYASAGVLIGRGDCKHGHAVAAATSVALASVMGPKFLRTRAAFPAGVFTVISIPAAIYDGYKANEWRVAELD